MAFQVDHSQVKDGGGVLPPGEYEVVIKFAGEAVARTGTPYINITTVVRNDLEQQFKNKYIFHKMWRKKDPSQLDLECGGFSFKQIQSMSKAAGLPNGQSYENLEAWCEAITDKPILVTVEHEEYNGAPQVKVKWVNESKHPQCNHQWEKEEAYEPEYPAYNEYQAKEIESKVAAKQVVPDDDIPF